MIVQQLSLARQIDIVFKELVDELSVLRSGTVFMHIRNNEIGKFGIRHDPIEGRDGSVEKHRRGLNEHQRYAFRKMAIQALEHKSNWTHGEIYFEFAIRNNILISSVQFESNYNMANLRVHRRN